jgi:myosin heavy subunit
VVRPGPGERNFHIFYQLLAAPKETRSRYKLSKPSSYFYLSQSDCFTVDQLDDAEEFAITESAMGAVGLSSSRRDAILGVVAAVLHLGNVKFSAKQIDDAEGADLVDMKPVENFCAILGLSPKALAKHLTTRKLQVSKASASKASASASASLRPRSSSAEAGGVRLSGGDPPNPPCGRPHPHKRHA